MAGSLPFLALTSGSLLAAVWMARQALDNIDQLVVVRFETELPLTDFKDVETGQRGFLLTGNPVFRDPYDEARP